MNLAISLAVGIFVILWIWIAFEIKNAPEYDEYGKLVKKEDEDL